MELARELEEYGLKCSVPTAEYEADSDTELDGVTPQVCFNTLCVVNLALYFALQCEFMKELQSICACLFIYSMERLNIKKLFIVN